MTRTLYERYRTKRKRTSFIFKKLNPTNKLHELH